MSQSGPVPNWTLTPNPHSMKDKRRCRRFLTGFGDPERSAGRRAQKARYSWSLLMGHGEDAVPSGGRLIEEILLAAFPIHAGGSIFRPFLQKLLEVLLRFLPPAAVVEVAGARELFDHNAGISRGDTRRTVSKARIQRIVFKTLQEYEDWR